MEAVARLADAIPCSSGRRGSSTHHEYFRRRLIAYSAGHVTFTACGSYEMISGTVQRFSSSCCSLRTPVWTSSGGSRIRFLHFDYSSPAHYLRDITAVHGLQIANNTLQPPDVVMFKPLLLFYSNALTKYLHNDQGVKKGDFFPLFYEAWTQPFQEPTILKTFRQL
jgi:hypothetical protein